MKLLYKIRSLQNKASNEQCQCITDLKLQKETIIYRSTKPKKYIKTQIIKVSLLKSMNTSNWYC